MRFRPAETLDRMGRRGAYAIIAARSLERWKSWNPGIAWMKKLSCKVGVLKVRTRISCAVQLTINLCWDRGHLSAQFLLNSEQIETVLMGQHVNGQTTVTKTA